VRFEVVTSMNQSYYDNIGHKMLLSYIHSWPEDVKLRIYTEDNLVIPNSLHYKKYDLVHLEPELIKFVNRNKDRKDQQNPKELHLGAVRFSYKTFSIINACTTSLADYVIWLDADTFTHTPPTHEFLESLVKPEAYLTYLGRENNYSECGFVIYNVNHECNSSFMESWKKLYTTDNVFRLPQWHDSYVFDSLRKSFEDFHEIANFNLSPWGKDYDHVFINSVLGEYMDHMKGDRKYEGKSKKSDLTRKVEASYWRDL